MSEWSGPHWFFFVNTLVRLAAYVLSAACAYYIGHRLGRSVDAALVLLAMAVYTAVTIYSAKSLLLVGVEVIGPLSQPDFMGLAAANTAAAWIFAIWLVLLARRIAR